MKLFYFIFLILTSCLLLGQSGSILNLKACIDLAISNNLLLKKTKNIKSQTYNAYKQSEISILPSLNFNGSHAYNHGQTLDRFTNKYVGNTVLNQNFNLSSDLILFSGLSQLNSIKSNKYQYLAANENYMQQLNDLSLNVATNYLNVLFSKDQLELAQSTYKLSEEQLVRIEQLISFGVLSIGSLFEIKAQLANDTSLIVNNYNNYQLAILNLKQLINIKANEPLEVEPPADINSLLESPIPEFTTIYYKALETQPSIKSAKLTISAQQFNLHANVGKILPQLSLSGNLATGTSGMNIDINTGKTKLFSDQVSSNMSSVMGLVLRVPIFNGLQNYYGIKNAKLNLKNAELDKEITEQNLYKIIVQAYNNAQAAYKKCKATKVALNTSLKAFEFAKEKLDAGSINIFEFNSNKTKLQAAEINYSQSKYDYLFKLKVLDFYLGKELSI